MARGEASTPAATSEEVVAGWDRSSSTSADNGSSSYSEAADSRRPDSAGEYDERRGFDPDRSLPDLGSTNGVVADRKSSLAFVVDFGGENSSCGLRCTDELSKYLPKRVQDRVRLRESNIRNRPTSKKDPAREGLQSKRSLPRLREQQRQTKCDPKFRPGVRKSSPSVYLPTIPSQNYIAPRASRTKNENPGKSGLNHARQGVEPLEELGASQSYTIINAIGEEVWNRNNAGNACRIDEEDETEVYELRDVATNNVHGITEQSVCVKTGSKQAPQGSNFGYKSPIRCQKLATGGWYRKQDLTAKPMETEIPKSARKWTPAVTRYEGTTNNNARSLIDRSRQTTNLPQLEGAARKASGSSKHNGTKYGAPSISQPLVDRCQAIGRTTGRVNSCPTVAQPPPSARTNRTFRLRCARIEAARNTVLVTSSHLQGAKCHDAGSATAGSSFTSISSRESTSMARGFLQHGAGKTGGPDTRRRTNDGRGKFPAPNPSVLKTRPLPTIGSRAAPKTREQGTSLEQRSAGLMPEVRAWHRRHQNPGGAAGKGSGAQSRCATPDRQCPPEVSSAGMRPGFSQDCLLITLESNKSPALLTDLSQKIEKKLKEINTKIGILNTVPSWTSHKDSYYMMEKNLVTAFSNICQIERHIADVQLDLKV